MADIVNPYANPYLPAFVNQRPRINDFKPAVSMPSYKQINSVTGFSGARDYAASNLAPGSSEIVAESDPSIARVYIVAKDGTGQPIVEGYKLLHEDEPKQITMDDLNTKMSELLDRMNKLEEDKKNDSKPGIEVTWQNNSPSTNPPRVQSNSTRNAQSTGSNSTGNAK